MKLRLSGMLCGLAAALALCPANVEAGDVVIKSGDLRITFVDEGNKFDVEGLFGKKKFRPVFLGSVPEASYETANGRVRTVSSAMFMDVDYRKKKINNGFGIFFNYGFYVFQVLAVFVMKRQACHIGQIIELQADFNIDKLGNLVSINFY